MVKLAACRLINCQSLGDVNYEFVEGLNVIIAPNNTGKSVFFKILKAACTPTFYDKDERKQLIAYGAEEATAIYLFTDNSCAVLRIQPSGCTYLFTDNYGEEEFEASVKPHPQMIKNLSLIVDPKEDYIANILDLDQNLLLVNSDLKANHNLVKVLTHNERLTNLIQNTDEKIKKYNKQIDDLDNIILNIEFRLRNYEVVDTHRLETSVRNLQMGLEIYGSLIEVYREIETFDVPEDGKNYKQLIAMADMYQEMESAVLPLEAMVEVRVDPNIMELLDMYQDLAIIGQLPEVDSEELDPAMLDVLDAYAELSRLNEVLVFGDVIDNEELDMFSGLLNGYVEAVNIMDVKAVNFNLGMLDVFEELNYAQYQAKMLHNNLADMEKLSVEIAEMQETINSMGRSVPCVIYGEVQHIDGQCIPKDYRYAQKAN